MTKEQDFFTTLDKLVMSKNNVRADDESPVDTLAASLLNHGQISALVVEPDGKRYGVVAGGRRYRAFRDLLKRKLITRDFPIKVTFRRQGIDAAEISLAENVERKQMHPAEEAEIFRRLIEEEQASRDQLAERLGVPLHHINRRLKLAKVAPQIIAAYKGGELTLVQTEAFAITDDHQRQVDYYSGNIEAPDESEITAEIERRKSERAATEEAEKEQQRELTADLSQALLGSLSLARTAALRATLADNQDVALRFVAYEFALHIRTAAMREHCPITEMRIGTSHLGEQAESLAGRAYEAHVERLGRGLPDDEQDLWDTIMDASTDEIVDIIAVGVAGTINAHTPQIDNLARSRKKWADNLAGRLNLDMREWWTADTDFFGRVSKGVLVNAMAEAAPEITGIQNPQKRDMALAALAKLPKKELVDKAAEAMGGSGWLPAPLRTPKLESQISTAVSLPAADEEAA